MGQLGEAIDVLEECLAQFPHYGSARVALARLYADNEQWDKGLEMAKHLLEEDPQQMQGLKIAARCAAQLGMVEDAIGYYQTLYALIHDDAILETIEDLKGEMEKRLPPRERAIARLKKLLTTIERKYPKDE